MLHVRVMASMVVAAVGAHLRLSKSIVLPLGIIDTEQSRKPMAAPRSYYGGTGLHVVVWWWLRWFCCLRICVLRAAALQLSSVRRHTPLGHHATTPRHHATTHSMNAWHLQPVLPSNLVVVGATNGTSGTEREQVQSGVRVSNSLASYFVATYDRS